MFSLNVRLLEAPDSQPIYREWPQINSRLVWIIITDGNFIVIIRLYPDTSDLFQDNRTIWSGMWWCDSNQILACPHLTSVNTITQTFRDAFVFFLLWCDSSVCQIWLTVGFALTQFFVLCLIWPQQKMLLFHTVLVTLHCSACDTVSATVHHTSSLPHPLHNHHTGCTELSHKSHKHTAHAPNIKYHCIKTPMLSHTLRTHTYTHTRWLMR